MLLYSVSSSSTGSRSPGSAAALLIERDVAALLCEMMMSTVGEPT